VGLSLRRRCAALDCSSDEAEAGRREGSTTGSGKGGGSATGRMSGGGAAWGVVAGRGASAAAAAVLELADTVGAPPPQTP
jgi:hypothetical protein